MIQLTEATRVMIESIHARGVPLVYEFAGAGSAALAMLHAVGGSSRTLIEATDRYSAGSLRDLLKRSPEKFVSPETAAAMSHRAYLRACRLSESDAACIGISCTATIATDRTKRGEHRIIVGAQSRQELTLHDLSPVKGRRERDAEEALASRVVINAIAQAIGIERRLELELSPEDSLRQTTQSSIDPLAELFEGRVSTVRVEGSGERRAGLPPPGIIYPGSFNPLHFGHRALAGAAERMTGQAVTFEISATNAEKPPIARHELERRIAHFAPGEILAVTRAPLFIDKARLFPGRTFLIGYDTAVRLIDPRFYGGEPQRDAVMMELVDLQARILVAGRLEDQTFKTLGDLPVPTSAKPLFEELPEAVFRADISATALRAAQSA